MPFRYNMGADTGSSNLDGRQLNSFVQRRAPRPGATQTLTGGGAQPSNQLSGATMYVLVVQSAFYVVSSGSVTGLAASSSDLYWPGNEPFYHLAIEGDSDYLSIIDAGGGAVTGSLAPLRDS